MDGVRTTQRTRRTYDLLLALETQDLGLLTTYNRIARGLVNLVVTDDTFPSNYLWFILMIQLTMVFHGRFARLSGLHTSTLFGEFGILGRVLPHLYKEVVKKVCMIDRRIKHIKFNEDRHTRSTNDIIIGQIGLTPTP
jgi:hypothetical protein